MSQIAGGRSEASWESIFEKDKEYVEHISFWGDIKIIFKNSLTITAILGLFFSILIFILAKPIAIIQQNESGIFKGRTCKI